MAQGLPYGNQLTRAIDAQKYRYSYDLLNFLEQTLRNGTRGYLNSIEALASVIQKGISNPADRLQINEGIAKLATDQVVKQYLAVINQNNVYRVGNRYSGGVLRAALEAPGVVALASADGIQFINQQALDKAAKQWRRLNFGAGQAGTEANERFNILFGPTINGSPQTVKIGSVSMDVAPRPGFLMPRGFFTGGRPSAFYPQSRVLTQPTKGIRSGHFLEKGFAAIAQTIGPEYSRYVGQAISNGDSALGQAIKAVQRPVVSFLPNTNFRSAGIRP